MPDTTEVIVEGFDEGAMDDELRRRYRWLSHLPTGADVVFVETDLRGVVSPESLEPFANALRMRRNKRKERAKRDDKAKAKSELRAEEDRPLPAGGLDFGGTDEAFFPPPSAYRNNPTLELHTFPPPSPSSAAPSNPPSVPAAASSPAPRTVWGTRSFASAGQEDESGRRYDEDDLDFDERWHDFEQNLRGGGTGGRGGGGGGGGAGARRVSGNHVVGGSTGANAGGGAVPGAAQTVVVASGGGGRRKKKLVLSLTGAGGRGTG